MTPSIDGIQLDAFIVGFTYDVGTMLACYLLAERFAEPVPDDSPTLVTPINTQIRFDVTALPGAPRVVSSLAQPSEGQTRLTH